MSGKETNRSITLEGVILDHPDTIHTWFDNTKEWPSITYGDIYVLHQRLKIQLQQLHFDLSELYSTGQKRRNMYLKMKDHCWRWQEFPQFD